MDSITAGLIEMNRRACVGTLVPSQAHDLNNPLAVVVAYLDLLVEKLTEGERHTFTTEELLPLVTSAAKGADNLRRIVGNLRSPFASEPAPDGILTWDSVIGGLLQVLERDIARRMRVDREVGPGSRVTASEPALRQILLNLLIAAVFVVPVGDRERNTLRVYHPEGMPNKLVIESSGKAQALDDGLRLGISVSRSLAESLGGSLVQETLPEGGIRFTLEFPAGRSEA